MTTDRTVEAITADLRGIEERRRQCLEELCEAVKRGAGGEIVQRKSDGVVFKIRRVEPTPVVLTPLVYGHRRRSERSNGQTPFAPYDELIGTPADFRPAVKVFGVPVVVNEGVPADVAILRRDGTDEAVVMQFEADR